MQPSITNCRDDQLLGLIRRRREDPDVADRAWLELYSRHAGYVFACVERAASFVGRGLSPEDIVVQTFSEVYLRAADGFVPGTYPCHDDARKHVRVWLGRVAHFELLGSLQSRAHESMGVRDPELLSFRPDSPHTMPGADGDRSLRNSTVVDAAEAALSPDEQEIVWLKMQYYNPDTGESWVPPKEVKLLCEKQGISNATFRKRYERALNKVKEALAAIDQGSRTYDRRI